MEAWGRRLRGKSVYSSDFRVSSREPGSWWYQLVSRIKVDSKGKVPWTKNMSMDGDHMGLSLDNAQLGRGWQVVGLNKNIWNCNLKFIFYVKLQKPYLSANMLGGHGGGNVRGQVVQPETNEGPYTNILKKTPKIIRDERYLETDLDSQNRRRCWTLPLV